MLRLHTSGISQRIRAATLVQAATLGKAVRDFLSGAFLHAGAELRKRVPLVLFGYKTSFHGIFVPIL